MKMKFSVLYYIMLIIMGILTGVAFLCSNMFPPNHYEYTTVEWDSLGIHSIVLAVLLLYFTVLRPRYLKNIDWNKVVKILLPCSMMCIFGGSLFWALNCQYLPVWDPEYICQAAKSFAEGGIPGEKYMAYLSKYPQQAGLVWLFSMLIRLFGVGGEAFMTLHIFLAVCVPLIVLSGYWLTDAIFEDKEVDVYFLILGMGCIALCAYVNFVYSDIPGILLALLSLNSIVRYGKERKILWGIIGCLLFLFGIVIRKHNMILVVAVTGIWLLYAVIQKSKRHALEAICGSLIVFVGSHFVIQCLGSIYELSFENAEPSIAWVAMGMQRSAYGAGWYNGFVDGVYTDKAGDAALIVQESIRQIKMSVMGFIREPLLGIRFYVDKLLIQWNQPCYQSLGLSKVYEEMPGGIVESIYQGPLYPVTMIYFDCYQWVIYLGFTIYLWKNRNRKEISIFALILVLAILGGGIFSMLWEAKSRYILPYLVLMIPFASMGWRGMIKEETKS